MSRIYFSSELEEAEVCGIERHYMSHILNKIGVIPLLSICESLMGKPPIILKCLPSDHYLVDVFYKRPKDFKKAFVNWFCTASEISDNLIVGECEHDCRDVALNTAIITGSDPIKLYARIHGSCEGHCYVEGHNRAWLSSIINRGLETLIYRENSGWEETVKMLENDDQHPVVLSYSICDGFPSAEAAGYDDEEGWYDLSTSKQWELGMCELRKNKQWHELSPDWWDGYYYAWGMTSFAIRQYCAEDEV